MRTSLAGAALLLAGAGAAGLAAAGTDTNGTGLILNGSDTLFDVTNQDVFSACATAFSGDWATSPITYQGGGSRVGAGNMDQGIQAISPMSSALNSGEFCSTISTATVYSPAVQNSPGLTSGLLVGLDGVALAANQVMSCSSSAANQVGASVAMHILTGGNGADTGATYTFGDSTAAMWKNQPSFDALAVLYYGLTHDGNYNCASDTRKSLIKSWKNLFASDCGTGDTTCSAGLTHAWRRSDLSGTTDAFTSIIKPPNGTLTNGKGAVVTVGIGSLPSLLNQVPVPAGAVTKSNPFCNSADATVVPAVQSPGGSADFSDLDPVRTVCPKGVDQVCEGFMNFGTTGGNNGGDLGVVLPILIPDTASVHPTDRYPQTTCGGTCAPFPAFKTTQASKYSTFVCPNGLPPVAGNICWMPYTGSDSAPDPRCTATNLDKCPDVPGGKPDGRRYNLYTMVASSQVTSAYRTGTYQFGVDATVSPAPRILQGGFHKIHSVVAGTNYAAGVGSETGTTGICQENDDTSQIGCLVDSDPCSVGYAGRESAQGFPGVSPTGPTAQPLKGLSINGTTPYTPSSVAIAAVGHADPDLAIKNLMSAPGTLPLYPLSRRLYFATIYGWSNLQGHELELARCYGTSDTMSSAMSNNGFVPAPPGVQCIDYPETNSTSTPPANTQGSGNAALGGCGAAGNSDACGGLVDTHGVAVPEATETF
ncbi:MAG TPA: hypothetical protein VMT03_00265 [Polyangia bacterium]|nr:hypothetical protein [Polyangia bacterium]